MQEKLSNMVRIREHTLDIDILICFSEHSRDNVCQYCSLVYNIIQEDIQCMHTYHELQLHGLDWIGLYCVLIRNVLILEAYAVGKCHGLVFFPSEVGIVALHVCKNGFMFFLVT